MSHFGDYMDGVPVKISEKYKRPPSIELPYSVNECPLRARNVVESVRYCSTFETNVLSKLRELRSAKETKKNEWRHRLQLLQEAKQKKLDAIAAAEAEEKLKQLSVSDVSYPSTDEISALSLDDKAEQTCDIPHKQSPEVIEPASDVTYPSCSNAQDSQQNILQPIQVQTSYHQNNLLDDPDPLQELKMSAKITKIPQYSNIDMLTYKDFENDTSSPFDNVELKTINDMELLAQVLQSQKDTSTGQLQNYVPETYTNLQNCASQAHMEGMTYIPNSYNIEQPIQGQSVMYLPQHYPVSNGYYVPAESSCDNPMQMDNINMYMPNYQYYVPTNQYPAVDPTYYGNQMPASSGEVNQVASGSYIPQPYYFQVPHMTYSPESTAYSTVPEQALQASSQNPSTHSQNTIKSRSRSVPDIVRELNEELASAKLRSNERSCTTSPAPKNIQIVPRSSSSSDKKEEKRSRRKSERLPNPFDKFPASQQIMCQKIHGMGFPLDRVARVSSLLGDNDKKVRISINKNITHSLSFKNSYWAPTRWAPKVQNLKTIHFYYSDFG